MVTRQSDPEEAAGQGQNDTEEENPEDADGQEDGHADKQNGHHPTREVKFRETTKDEDEEDDYDEFNMDDEPYPSKHDIPIDPNAHEQQDLIAKSTPTTPLEIALKAELDRQINHNERLTTEITKLKQFISKRKQTYKRKRKEEGAPRKSLSAYNLFVRERFAKLAKENESALKSADTDAQLKRVPPASLVAKTGNEWRALSAEEKAKYEEM